MSDIEVMLGEIIEMANRIRMHIGNSGQLADEIKERCGDDVEFAHQHICTANYRAALK